MTGQIRIDQAGPLATVWIDNTGKRNAINQQMWTDIGDAFEKFSASDSLRCIIIRGAGSDSFGSGADIEEFPHTRSNREQATHFARHVHRAMHQVRDCPIPVLAAIRGVCVGGGLELAAVCDMRIATEDSRFGVPIARLGATLAYAELEGLMNLVGASVALELLLEGRIFGAQEALAKGLVGRLLPDADFEIEVAATAQRICKGAPMSARAHKKFVARLRNPAPLTVDEVAEGLACFDTEDYRIGYRTFLDKTEPVFVGR
ncbi:MAG: enoyl-CoA hydratase-related protein [Polaromonas sp.]|nr:enoyl-CoA hydratase-related protein [Polaromonas sp.]